jgi:shikimate kinase
VTLEANRELMARHGISVWLNPPFATIVERIGARGKADRPLFVDETHALALYRERLPLYRRCQVTVDVEPREEAAEVAARIELLVAQRACGS